MLHHDFLWQWCEQWKSRKARLTHLNASYFVARKRWSSKRAPFFCQVTMVYWMPKYSVTDWRMDLIWPNRAANPFIRDILPISAGKSDHYPFLAGQGHCPLWAMQYFLYALQRRDLSIPPPSSMGEGRPPPPPQKIIIILALQWTLPTQSFEIKKKKISPTT